MTEAKLYTCHKQVMARPMTRGQYCDLRGWSVPTNEDPNDDGYLVEYLDGGPANVPGFDHYISWSPQAVFDKGYSLVPANHQERALAELTELNEKIKKLLEFRVTETFKALPAHERVLLRLQVTHMINYGDVLKERVAIFKETAPA